MVSAISTAITKWTIVRTVTAWGRQLMARPILYPNRGVLEREAPLRDRIQEVANIDALWLHGGRVIDDLPDLSKIRRLILPNPSSGAVAQIQAAMSDQSARNLAASIKERTRRAKDKGVCVRWIDEFPGYTLLIGDGRGRSGWCQIELTILTGHGSNDPTFEIIRSKHGETLDAFIDAFEKLWDDEKLSREPRPEEYADDTEEVPQLGRSSPDEAVRPLREGTSIDRGSGEV